MIYDSKITPEMQENIDQCFQKLARAFLTLAEELIENGEADEFLKESTRLLKDWKKAILSLGKNAVKYHFGLLVIFL